MKQNWIFMKNQVITWSFASHYYENVFSLFSIIYIMIHFFNGKTKHYMIMSLLWKHIEFLRESHYYDKYFTFYQNPNHYYMNFSQVIMRNVWIFAIIFENFFNFMRHSSNHDIKLSHYCRWKWSVDVSSANKSTSRFQWYNCPVYLFRCSPCFLSVHCICDYLDSPSSRCKSAGFALFPDLSFI